MSITHKKLLALIFLSGIAMGIPFLFSKMISVDGDAYGRSAMSSSERININEFFNFNPNRYQTWLPLHTKILGLSLMVYDDVFFSPRFITLLFSSGIAVLMYYYAFIITGSARISMLSSTLFLIFPQRILLSTFTFSETIFVFFLISAFILIFKKLPNYSGGLMLLNIASGIRYESWFLLPFVWFAILKDRSLKLRPIFILASSFFPIFWLSVNGIFTGNPINFLTKLYRWANMGWTIKNPGFLNFPVAFSNWFIELFGILTVLGIGLVIFGWYQLVRAENDWKKHILLLFPFWAFFILPIQVFVKTMESYPDRYLFIPISLAFPLLAYGIAQLRTKLKLSPVIKRFPIYNYLILLIGLVYTLQIYLNGLSKFNNTKRYFDENKELETAVETIKTKSSYNSSLDAAYYHNMNAGDRLWKESYIQYFSKLRTLHWISKEKLAQTSHKEDIIIVEDPKNDNNIVPLPYLSDYDVMFKGKLFNIYFSRFLK